MGIYLANADDAPGAAVMGMLLMVVGVVLGLRAARCGSPDMGCPHLAGGVVVAAFAAFLTHGVVVTTSLPAVAGGAIGVVGLNAAAICGGRRARATRARSRIGQSLPGVSVAVGAGGTVVWAEGFGWRTS